MLSWVGIEPRPLIASDSKSNTILSTLKAKIMVKEYVIIKLVQKSRSILLLFCLK